MNLGITENYRLELQDKLDSQKTKAERNKLGQFATPPALADSILMYAGKLLSKDSISFLDPAIGTGAFYSALLKNLSPRKIKRALGFEIDAHYGLSTKEIWKETALELQLSDFTKADIPTKETSKFDLIICNPPYVRHHHFTSEEKVRMQQLLEESVQMKLTGLAGLYCYFMGLAHSWMKKDGIAGWLIPSEFMDVNYGSALKDYLLSKVTLLRIHRFDPNDLQFNDALVSSAIVWFKNTAPEKGHQVEFSFGGDLNKPDVSKLIAATDLRKEKKWTRFPLNEIRKDKAGVKLSDLFDIKRGLATGNNKFFILSDDEVKRLKLSNELLRPVLPSPRYLNSNEILADDKGVPLLDQKYFLLDCKLPETELQDKYPTVWQYLENGRESVSKGYLCSSRKKWYFQEDRDAAPLLCTYIGRSTNGSDRPFRFLLNKSQATATNSYLLLYPKRSLASVFSNDVLGKMWTMLNELPLENLLDEGRVYGGGMHKLEPKELANVDMTSVVKSIKELAVIAH